MKVKTTNRKISPFGGINFIVDEVEKAGIPAIINSSLPKRHRKATYTHADCLLSLVYGIFCGAERLEDFVKLKGRIYNSCINIPSPDVLGKICKKDWKAVKETQGNHDFYLQDDLNGLMIDIALHLNILDPLKDYTLDLDHVPLPCEKWDSTFCYKGFRAYMPGVCFLSGVPVWIEGQNGNNPPAFGQIETVQRCLKQLDEKGITISRFRADAASYQKEVIKQFDDRQIEFFVRAVSSNILFDEIQCVEHWEPVRLGTDTFELAQFHYNPFNLDGLQRVIVARRPSKNGKLHEKTEEPFIYRSILTNNMSMKSDQVVWFYNQRGGMDCEKAFDVLNNDWNWSSLPFSFLAENTPFLIVTAIGYVLYKYLLKVFSEKVDFVEPTFRMKAFHYNFIAVSAQWMAETLLIHDTTREWEKLAS